VLQFHQMLFAVTKLLLAVAVAALPLAAQTRVSDPGPAPRASVAPAAAVVKDTRSTSPSKKRTKGTKHEQQPYTIAPMTPEMLPATAPQVSYLNGQLTIQSTNSTLSDILNAVRARTGAQIDAPAGFGGERVATRLGPGPARDVLIALLSGSKYGYVILGAPNSPGAVQKVMVTGPQNAAPGGPATMSASRTPPPASEVEPDEEPEAPPPPVAAQPPTPSPGAPPGLQPNMPPEVAPAQPAPFGAIPAQPGTPQVGPGPYPAPGQPGAPQVAPGGVQAQPMGPQNPNQPQAKTPEQLLRELQQMQHQQLHQQQQQPPQ
jgi:hypothetical protein